MLMPIDEARKIDEQNTLRRSRLLNIQYYDTSVQANQLYQNILSVPEMYDLKIVPLFADSHHLQFGVTNTTSQSTMSNLRQRFADQKVAYFLISDTGYRELMHRYDPPKEVIYQDLSLSTLDATDKFSEVSGTLNTVRADDLLAYIVKQAYELHASDIHLETGYESVRIRFRIDGVLHPIAELYHDKYKQLLSSLAIVANISTSSTDAQMGHINKTFNMADGASVTVNMRVETIPTVYGMDVVMRLFNINPELMRIEKLGLRDSDQAIVSDIISHPTGLVLMVGPTGSGKTTTLYSIINELNNPERKIITLEDPVEYYIPGVTQIPIDSQNEVDGFASKFKAVLRLDPDVVMVGEIRDFGTAKTALQASLTGHLVLSTYHASSAAAALTRMMDMIGDNPLFASAIRLVTAQRLIRRLDDNTKKEYIPNEHEKKWIQNVLDSMPNNVQKPDIDSVKLYEPGSSESNPFGYSGQFAVRELLLMTDNMQKLLRKPAHDITTTSIEEVATKDGMLTIMQDGVLRVLSGETSLKEVMRVLA